MKSLSKSAALIAALAFAPSIAHAQQAPAAVIVVVDTGKIFAECNACKSAQTQLQAQAASAQQRAQALSQPLQTEEEAIRAAVNAAAGKPLDTALQARVQAFQAKQQAAQQELAGRQQTFDRNRAYVGDQITAKLNPIIKQTMQKRGATLALDTAATLGASGTIDVTTDVLAQLNAQLPSVNVNAPAPAPQPAAGQPAGR